MYVEYDVKKLKDELTVEDINKIVGELGGENPIKCQIMLKNATQTSIKW